MDALVRANPGLTTRLQLASVRATLGSFFPAGAGRPWGWQDQQRWTAFGEWMLHQHLIKHASTIANASTNELLAGQGP